MSNNNWYNPEDWYVPNAAPENKKKKKRRKNKKARTVGLIFLVLLLIVGSSLAFGAGRKDLTPSPQLPGYSALPFVEDLPDKVEDFFADYYQSVTYDAMLSDVPRAKLPIDFEVEFKPAGDEELQLTELYAKCAPSITAIVGYKGDRGYSWGTGVVISADGLILTNAHIVDGCDKIEVTSFEDRVYVAKLVGADNISDLAVLKVQSKNLVPAEFGDSAQLQVGQPVAAIGNPLGEEFRSTLTDGIISAIERGLSNNGYTMSLLQTNTALNKGNSGGALFNMYGQVIGITNMKMMSSYTSIEGIGFAIPSETVKRVVDSLVLIGQVQGRPSIGITVGSIPENAKMEYDLPDGLYISAVSEDSDAYKKGILPGDVLLEVNGVKVRTTEDVNALKDKLQVGDTMDFLIWRNGETLVFEVELYDTSEIYG